MRSLRVGVLGFEGVMAHEAVVALREVAAPDLLRWSRNGLVVAAHTVAIRFNSLFRLFECAARGGWKEFKALWGAMWEGKLCEYLMDRCRELWAFFRSMMSWVRGQIGELVAFGRNLGQMPSAEVAGHAVSLLAAVLGFCVMGGRADGEMIDSDTLVKGWGSQRSIWFHPAAIGIAADVCLRAVLDLVELLYAKLPREHHPIWDRLSTIKRIWGERFINGSWVGVSAHVADGSVKGWTPYQDLPVAASNSLHHLVMDVNAAVSGAGAWFLHYWTSPRVRRHHSMAVLNGIEVKPFRPLQIM